MKLVDIDLPPAEPYANPGHCVRCGNGPLTDVRVEYYDQGHLFVRVPAWDCRVCGERYYHTGTISCINAWLHEHAG